MSALSCRWYEYFTITAIAPKQTLRDSGWAAATDPKQTPKLVLPSKQHDDLHRRYKNLFFGFNRL
jgi:hypothetical protein